MALHSEVLSGATGSSCRAMSTHSGSPGLLGEAGAIRLIKDTSTSVATQTALESKSSILWWMTLDNLYKGVPLGTVVIDEYLFTDSSIRG